MPIETDNSNHDFVWRFNPQSESQQAVFFPLRLHKTPEYGWTISFLNDQGQPEFSLPADMFSEAADYVSTFIAPTANAVRTNSGTTGKPVPKIGLPSVGRAASASAAKAPQSRPASRTTPTPSAPRPPQLIRPDGSVDHAAMAKAAAAAKVKAEGLDKEFEAAPVDIDEDFGPQDGTFLPTGHNVEDVDFDDQAPVFQSFTVPVQSKPKNESIAPEEQAKILAERQAALANPAKKVGIKKRHAD
jgi:hypothetical protein